MWNVFLWPSTQTAIDSYLFRGILTLGIIVFHCLSSILSASIQHFLQVVGSSLPCPRITHRLRVRFTINTFKTRSNKLILEPTHQSNMARPWGIDAKLTSKKLWKHRALWICIPWRVRTGCITVPHLINYVFKIYTIRLVILSFLLSSHHLSDSGVLPRTKLSNFDWPTSVWFNSPSKSIR